MPGRSEIDVLDIQPTARVPRSALKHASKAVFSRATFEHDVLPRSAEIRGAIDQTLQTLQQRQHAGKDRIPATRPARFTDGREIPDLARIPVADGTVGTPLANSVLVDIWGRSFARNAWHHDDAEFDRLAEDAAEAVLAIDDLEWDFPQITRQRPG